MNFLARGYNISLILLKRLMDFKEIAIDRWSKFDWHDMASIFFALMLLHNLKVFQKPIKHLLQLFIDTLDLIKI